MKERNRLGLGCVAYTETANGIEAKWIYNQHGEIQQGIGKGIRIGRRKYEHRFEGEYEISYSDQNGTKSPDLNLTITYSMGFYDLSWKKDGVTTELGIGMMVNDVLLASYTEVINE